MGDKAPFFDESLLQEGGHVCAFFNSRDQEYRVLMPFIKEGFERGEKAFHTIDPALRQDHLHRLHAEGIDVEPAMARKQLEVAAWHEVAGPQLEIVDWDDAYLKGDHFEKGRVRALTRHQHILGDLATGCCACSGIEAFVQSFVHRSS